MPDNEQERYKLFAGGRGRRPAISLMLPPLLLPIPRPRPDSGMIRISLPETTCDPWLSRLMQRPPTFRQCVEPPQPTRRSCGVNGDWHGSGRCGFRSLGRSPCRTDLAVEPPPKHGGVEEVAGKGHGAGDRRPFCDVDPEQGLILPLHRPGLQVI